MEHRVRHRLRGAMHRKLCVVPETLNQILNIKRLTGPDWIFLSKELSQRQIEAIVIDYVAFMRIELNLLNSHVI